MITKKNFDLSQYNSYRIRSRCAVAHFPESEQDIIDLYRKQQDYILIGSGHNIIFSKPYYNEEFVIFNGNYENIHLEDGNCIMAESGAFMTSISEFALEHALSGLEIFYDIPSSLGGAVVMNAGASGEEIKDILVKVRFLSLEDMTVKEILKEEIDFEYRNSFFQRHTNNIILSAKLALTPGKKEEIKEKMNTIRDKRWAKQPRDLPNAGSVFKRPKGYYVGALIDELKLKGLTCGGAKISEKHGGFIVNFNEATGEDILSIINQVRQRVRKTYGVELEVEQRVI